MFRSWTLQEGQLPPTVTVQFLDLAVVLGRGSAEDGRYRERPTTDCILTEDPRTPFEARTLAGGEPEGTALDNEPSLHESRENEHPYL